MTDVTETQSRKAFRELLASLAEVDERYLSSDFGVASEQDDADGHRFLIHLLETALHREFEGDPEHPEFTKWVTPRRKVLGDNPDAIYFDAPVDPRYVYRVRGNIGGAVYTSITIDAGTADGGYATRTAGVINDTNFDVAPDGSYEITLGGPPHERNWMELPEDAGHLTTRHYFELAEPAGADATRVVPLTIERIGAEGPPPAPTDASVAAGIRRVNNFVRGNTVERPPRREQKLPSFVSIVPNVFPQPVVPGRSRPRRVRCRVLLGHLRARARRSAGRHHALARMSLRQRHVVDALPADVRLRAPALRPQPGQHDAGARRQLPDRDRSR